MKLIEDERPIILRILKGLQEATPVGDTPSRRALWDRCWAESGPVPDYFSGIVRVRRHFYDAPGFEFACLVNTREELYGKYFADVDAVHEFGCGIGHNLAPLLGKKEVHGYDWSEAAVERVRAMGASGHLFDMFNPTDLTLKGGGVLTVHALEQLGIAWGAFLDFLWKAKPAICVHIEPLHELYDEAELLDYLALQYHRKRNYLHGYLTALRALARDGVIEILEERRTFVGSLYHEAYSILVWRMK